MRLTSKGRYAVGAVLDLTKHSNGNPVRLQEISDRQNISLHYLGSYLESFETDEPSKVYVGQAVDMFSQETWTKSPSEISLNVSVKISTQLKIFLDLKLKAQALLNITSAKTTSLTSVSS